MIWLTAGVIGLVGLACGATLSLAARYLGVEEDPRIREVEECLPGVNCGGCGYAGCAAYAAAVVLEGADINLCAPGGEEVVHNLAGKMGVEAVVGEREVAIVLCGGDSTNAGRKSVYNGVADCAAAAAVNGGDKTCVYGCLGYGSCARACPVGAIEITRHGLARVHPQLCIGCGKCVRTCPRNLIRMVPVSRKIHVLCSSRDKGPLVKKACKVGCIGCTICTKLVEDNAIKMDGALAVVDYSKPIENEVVAAKCPGRCIVNLPGAMQDSKPAGEAGGVEAA